MEDGCNVYKCKHNYIDIMSEPDLLKIMYEHAKPILLYRSKFLDYGCGDGMFTRFLTYLHGENSDIPVKVVGYDPKPENINLAIKRNYSFDNIRFTSDNELVGAQYDAAWSLFVLHHDKEKESLEEIFSSIKKGGHLMVLDYDIKGVSKDKFRKLFKKDRELHEITDHGLEGAYSLHTRLGLEDCINDAETVGFKTILEDKISKKYFLWIGMKPY